MSSGSHNAFVARREADRAAEIFLKPSAWRHRFSHRLADAVLRLLIPVRKARSRPEIGEMRKVLVFDIGGLGDVILAIPFLRSLRARLPGIHITLIGRPGTGSILVEQGLINEWMPLRIPWTEKSSRWRANNPFSVVWLRLIRDVLRLRVRGFDLAFVTGWSFDVRSNLVLWLSGARRRIAYGYAGGDFLLTDVVQPDLARPHVVDRSLRLLEHIGAPVVSRERALTVTPEEARGAAEFLERQGVEEDELVIGIHAGAGSAIREWGDERFGEVARWAAGRFGARILWFTDPAKPKPIPANVDAIRLALPFSQLIAVLSHCRLFICNDSGPMHVAAALGVPVVAVFGPQRPEWFGPYGEGHRIVIRHDIWCRPCADQCRWKEPHCLRLISVEHVMEAVRSRLECLDSVPKVAGHTSVREFTELRAHGAVGGIDA